MESTSCQLQVNQLTQPSYCPCFFNLLHAFVSMTSLNPLTFLSLKPGEFYWQNELDFFLYQLN